MYTPGCSRDRSIRARLLLCVLFLNYLRTPLLTRWAAKSDIVYPTTRLKISSRGKLVFLHLEMKSSRFTIFILRERLPTLSAMETGDGNLL